MRRGLPWLVISLVGLPGLVLIAGGCEGDDNSGGGGGQVTNVSKTNADPTKGATSEDGSDAAVTGSEQPAQSGQTGTTGTGGSGQSGSK